jgi:hypothetical protein
LKKGMKGGARVIGKGKKGKKGKVVKNNFMGGNEDEF